MVRKKTQTNMIEGANARQVAFSKRRTGVFKKASELCTLCAAETALVVFSPGGKAFTFGHPCFNAAMKKFADPANSNSSCAKRMAEQEATLSKLNKQYSDLLQQLAAEKKRGEELKRKAKGPVHPLLASPLEELNLDELLTLKAFMEHIKAQLLNSADMRGFKLSLAPASTSGAGSSAETTNPSVAEAEGISGDANGDVCNGN